MLGGSAQHNEGGLREPLAADSQGKLARPGCQDQDLSPSPHAHMPSKRDSVMSATEKREGGRQKASSSDAQTRLE